VRGGADKNRNVLGDSERPVIGDDAVGRRDGSDIVSIAGGR
jgi:hypothetical protein